jgi:ATP/maltotriose-dependent transcriptional regulator MalT
VADDSGAASALNEKTSQLTMLGDLGKARESCQHSLALAQKSGNKHMIVADVFYLGNIAKLEGKLDDARKTFSDSLPLAREAGGSALIALFEEGLAEVADEQNQQVEARRQINELLSSLHEHRDPTNEIGAESLLARIALEQGDTAAAVRAIAAARSLLRQSQGWEERFLFGIADARVQAAVGRLDQARQSLNTVVADVSVFGGLCNEEQARSKGFALIARKAAGIGA